MATIKGIEVSGITYDLEDEDARNTATSAQSTATSAQSTATSAQSTATSAQSTATSAQSTADANTQEISNIKADITTVNQQISLIRTIQSDSQAVETRTLSLPVTVTPARYRITFSSQLFNSAEAFYGEWIVSFAGSGTAVVEISKSSNITFSYSDGVCTFSTPFNTSYGRITYETL